MTQKHDGGPSFRIRQNGVTVCKTDGPIAEGEIWHYAQQYRRDGELTIQHNVEGHWKRYALLCQWPIAARSGGET